MHSNYKNEKLCAVSVRTSLIASMLNKRYDWWARLLYHMLSPIMSTYFSINLIEKPVKVKKKWIHHEAIFIWDPLFILIFNEFHMKYIYICNKPRAMLIISWQIESDSIKWNKMYVKSLMEKRIQHHFLCVTSFELNSHSLFCKQTIRFRILNWVMKPLTKVINSKLHSGHNFSGCIVSN